MGVAVWSHPRATDQWYTQQRLECRQAISKALEVGAVDAPNSQQASSKAVEVNHDAAFIHPCHHGDYVMFDTSHMTHNSASVEFLAISHAIRSHVEVEVSFGGGMAVPGNLRWLVRRKERGSCLSLLQEAATTRAGSVHSSVVSTVACQKFWLPSSGRYPTKPVLHHLSIVV